MDFSGMIFTLATVPFVVSLLMMWCLLWMLAR